MTGTGREAPELARWWTEAVAAAGDAVPLPLLTVLLLLAAGLVAAGWYWFPAWVPRRLPRPRLAWLLRLRLPRLRRPRWRRRRVHRPAGPPTGGRHDGLPDLPAATFTSLADQLAAQGRYAEAVRERHRAMVRELIEHGVVEPHPEWTVNELADAAVKAWPPAGPPLRAAGAVFSELWYGRRPASVDHDARMRHLAGELAGSLHASSASTVPLPTGAGTAGAA